MPDNNPIIIVCASADEPLTVAGSDFSRFCKHCGQYVQVSPDGVKILKDKLDAQTWCIKCALEADPKSFFDSLDTVSVEDVLNAVRMAVPNMHRQRN